MSTLTARAILSSTWKTTICSRYNRCSADMVMLRRASPSRGTSTGTVLVLCDPGCVFVTIVTWCHSQSSVVATPATELSDSAPKTYPKPHSHSLTENIPRTHLRRQAHRTNKHSPTTKPILSMHQPPLQHIEPLLPHRRVPQPTCTQARISSSTHAANTRSVRNESRGQTRLLFARPYARCTTEQSDKVPPPTLPAQRRR